MDKRILIGVSTVADGNMSVKWGEKTVVEGNRMKFLDKLGIKYEDCVLASLLGGTEINIVDSGYKKKYIEGDALITKEKGVGLFMVTADCLPVVLYDKTRQILALVHLGWRGVDGKLAIKVIKKLGEFGCKPADIQVWIGPGVKKETYIKYGKKLEEFRKIMGEDSFREWQEFLVKTPIKDQFGVDLIGFVWKQLDEMGIKKEQIDVSNVDTIRDTNYFSHYRAGQTGEKEGRFATVAMIKKMNEK